jgi:hypothetical protein
MGCYFLVYGTGSIIWTFQCCESEFFPSWIPDPNFLHPGYRIRIKQFKYFNTIKWFISSRKSGLFIPNPDPDFLPIPDPGSRGQKAPYTGSGSATPELSERSDLERKKKKTCKFSHKGRHNSRIHNTYILKIHISPWYRYTMSMPWSLF